MHLRIASFFIALAAAMFVQVGLCPNCTFGICGSCEMAKPMPQQIEETHDCCRSGDEMPMRLAENDKEPSDSTHQCDGECSLKRAIQDHLWSQVKAFKAGDSTSVTLLVAESGEPRETVRPDSEHPTFIHPPPRLHCSIATTVLQL